MKIYENVTELIGNTPLVKLNNIMKKFELKANVIAKVEFLNPGLSIKDRVAYAMIKDAEGKGKINSKTVIIEPTSGNTGIGLALICATKGYKLVLTMPSNMSIERQKLLKAYGATIVLTDAKEGMTGAIKKANELEKEYDNSIILGQFTNPVNPYIHKTTTAEEIITDTDGKIDILVAGVGTGGTITGIGERLKEYNCRLKIIGIEPSKSAVLSGKEKGTHNIQGIGAGFIPEILNTKIYDEIICINDDEAISYSNILTKNEGIFTGISSGAALCGAIEIAKREENEGKNIVVILPDTGERYLSVEGFIK